MPTKTIFLAQAFHWHNGKLEPGRKYQFSSAAAAIEAGQGLAPTSPGVAVFSLDGDPATDTWDDPVLLARYGVAPPDAN